MAEPKLQHYADELRGISKILDLLNDPVEGDSNMGISGHLEVWNADVLMGSIEEEAVTGHWVYLPEARDSDEEELPEGPK